MSAYEKPSFYAVLSDGIKANLIKIKTLPNVLAFSCGADSVAALIRLIENGIRPTLVYFEYIPDMYMTRKYLEYIQNIYHLDIYTIPSPLYHFDVLNGLYQHPGVGKRIYDTLNAEWSVPNTGKLNKYILESFGEDAIMSIGIKVSDHIFRANKLKTKGVFDETKREFYPVGDCNPSDIHRIIKDAGIKLPIDYRLFGRSFESLRHWNAPQIKEHCPKTWAQLIETFPKANLLVTQARLLNDESPKRRVKFFHDLAFDSEECT